MHLHNKDIFQGYWHGMVHCANLHHVMGGGIARIIKERFPVVYDADCRTPVGDKNKLGFFSSAKIQLIGFDREIFNLYGQMGIGNDGTPLNRNARYDAIHDGMLRICEYISKSPRSYKYSLGIPHGMASALAGGDWNIVEAILKSVESRFPDISFNIYKL